MGSSLCGLDHDGGSVRQHFGLSAHDLRGVITHAEHSVGAVFRGMLQHQVERIGAGLLAEVAKDGDVAANDGLKACADRAQNGARTNDDSPDDSEVAGDAVAWQFEGSGDVFMSNHKGSYRR